ncbi:hypothetical protein [Dorea longicatena]|uniref:hypothetical protein n=1 Tax=Dorea longicatena TaxID=88431 RepID=UPI0015702334|nr:hypothetical protein [Dorea longicatena]NSD68962.1 hypothetical protein [Dorea longicatena]
MFSNFEVIHKDNLVIGYYIDKAIVSDEYGRLYYIECDENEAPIGTVADEDMLEDIDNLSEHEREYIIREYRESKYDEE